MWGILATVSIPTGAKQPLPANSHCSVVLCEKHCEEHKPASGVCSGLCFMAVLCTQGGRQFSISLQRTFTERDSLDLIIARGAGQHRIWAMSCF